MANLLEGFVEPQKGRLGLQIGDPDNVLGGRGHRGCRCLYDISNGLLLQNERLNLSIKKRGQMTKIKEVWI